jgi:hypothetical protein
MIDTPGQISGGQIAGSQIAGGNGTAPRDERSKASLSASMRLGSAISADADTATTLDTAMAQLSTLRNLATVAAANGNLTDLRQLAEHAVAVGVTAGAHAESLSGEIAAKLAIATQNRDGGIASPASKATVDRSALGLDPAVITQAFASQPDGPASGDPAASQPAGAATDLNRIASLNYRASTVITEARSLLASMNAAFNDPDAASPPAGGQEVVSLNGLAGLLDQAESALTAHTLALSSSIGGASGTSGAPSATSSAATGDKTVTPALDLTT